MTAHARGVRSTTRRISPTRLLAAIAYEREQFKNKVAEHVGGALLEHYKARLAKKNGETKWVDHWTSETTTLVDRSMVAALVHPIRGFKDRGRAAHEAFDEIKANDAAYRRVARNIVKRDFGLTKVKKPLDDGDTDAFWAMVERAAEPALC